MKLLTKTTLYYLIFTLPLLLLSGWFLYTRIEKSLKEEIDEELLNSKELWIEHIKTISGDSNILLLSNPFIQVEKSSDYSNEDVYADTLLYQPVEKEKVPYRNLSSWFKRGDQSYKLSFQRSVLEQEDVFKNLILLMCFVFGGMLALFLLINLYINKKVWKPFNISLEKITSLNMQQLQGVHFDKVSIREFNALNRSLNSMTSKMNTDFISMKTFTQNASHEIQTPLAIIQSKLEVLLQDSKLTEEQFLAISSASEATQRLSRLNQSLLLITRIENNQFAAEEKLSIGSIIEKYLSFFAEMMVQKKITVRREIKNDWEVFIHPSLADMLVSNLLSNAIKYNNAGGEINISIVGKMLIISNSSDLPQIKKDKIFHRFSKHDTATGNGLGLAIVKEICDANNLSLNYRSAFGFHEFIIKEN
ncbi:MAG: HAMP domain-containing sensor histidine kinase [Ferruginibacter sp.]